MNRFSSEINIYLLFVKAGRTDQRMTNVERYDGLCKQESSIPLFSKKWWLDAVCGENCWDAAIVEKGGQVIGTMPYTVKKRMGFTLLTQPPLTQTLGPWIRPLEAKYSTVLGYQKDVMEALIGQLPRFDHFSQNWHYSNTNWQPFYWKGFKQKTYYTYMLDDLQNEEALWNGIEPKIRTDIKKATDRFQLKVRDDLGWQDFFDMSTKTFGRQKMAVPYSADIVERIDRACEKRGCRKIWIAEDARGRRHAGAYIVWDENSAYYLMGGGDPELRHSGATSMVVWAAIKHAATVTKTFDFEGSMLEPVERFFRGFGAQQVPYFHISKTPSFILRLREAVLMLAGKR